MRSLFTPAVRRGLALGGCAVLSAACSSGGGGITVSTPTTPASVSSVTVAPPSASVPVGGTAGLSASVAVAGGAASTVVWSTSSASIATVVPNGNAATVTGVAPGIAAITATSTVDASKSSSSQVTVTAPVVSSIVISATTGSIRVGGTLQITAVARDASNNVLANPALTWTSGTTSAATISATGLLTGVGGGSTTVTARSGNTVSNNLVVTVTPLVTVTAWTPAPVLPSAYLKATGPVNDLWSPTLTLPIYAVTGDGVTGSWNGAAWTVVDQNSVPMYGVSGVSATEVYAVGLGGLIRRFNGASWSTMSSATPQTLAHIWLSSAGNGIAVGVVGTIVRMVSGVWSTMTSGFNGTLYTVWGSSPTNVFAVGDSGVILHFNGTTWARQTSGTTSPIFGIWGRGANFAVAAGVGGYIGVWNGVSWTKVSGNTTNDLYAVAGDSSSGSVAISGANGTVLVSSQAASGTWTSSSALPNTAPYYSIVDTDAGGIYAGFEEGGVTRRSIAGSWSLTTFAPILWSVVATSATAAYSAGDYGASAQLVAGAWQPQSATAGSYDYFTQLWAPVANQIYGARFSGVFRFDGSSWTPQYQPAATTRWTGVGGTSTTNAFATGNVGILARLTGTTWAAASPNPLASTDFGWAVGGASTGPLFVIGFDINSGNGFIQRFSNNAWVKMTVPTTATMRGIFVVDSLDAFAVGAAGTILRYNGTSWAQMASNTTADLYGIWAPSVTEAYAVGTNGTIVRWDGSIWTPMSSGTTNALRGVNGISGSLAIAVGDGMTIVMGTPTAASRSVAVRPMRVNAARATAAGDASFGPPTRQGSTRESGTGSKLSLQTR